MIYLLHKKKEDIEKNYDISKQKELFIKVLRQLIDDENKIDFNSLGNNKIEINKELNKLVDELDRLITTNFISDEHKSFIMDIMNTIDKKLPLKKGFVN